MLRITFAMCGLMLLLQAAIDAGQLAKNRGQKTPTNKGVQVKGRDINLGRASASLGKIRMPLPPPSEGWLVIMQRFDLSLDFNRNWTEYKYGFGELQKEFWLGNEAMHLLTSGVPHKLRIELITNDTLLYADYNSFSVDSEDKKYTLHVSGYTGNAGDSMTAKGGGPGVGYSDGIDFSTPDADNDNLPNTTTSCANVYKAGWWFNSCQWACLTCPMNNVWTWQKLEELGLNGLLIGARMRIMRK